MCAGNETCPVVGMANSEKNTGSPIGGTPARPVHDEWGIYDPQRAGLAAVFRMLSTLDNSDRSRSTENPAPATPPGSP